MQDRSRSIGNILVKGGHLLYLEALTKIKENNEFMCLRRYCLFVRLFFAKNITKMD